MSFGYVEFETPLEHLGGGASVTSAVALGAVERDQGNRDTSGLAIIMDCY